MKSKEAAPEFAIIVNHLLNVQNKNTGIVRKFDLAKSNDETIDGYVKICTHWLSRFWNATENKPFEEMTLKRANESLNNVTEIFD